MSEYLERMKELARLEVYGETQTEAIARGIESSIKPEVLLTREHKEMIQAIAEVWLTNSALARRLERNFVAILNNETHEQ